MTGTFLCPNTCGFARVLALEALRKAKFPKEKEESKTRHNARLQQECYKMFKASFDEVQENFDIGFDKFKKKLPGLKEYFGKWNARKLDEKKKYLETFSSAKWEKLSTSRKLEHSFVNCKSCALRHTDIQALFPVKSNSLKGKACLNPIFNANNEGSKLRSPNAQRAVKPSQHEVNKAAQAAFDTMAASFEKAFKTNFTQVIAKLPEIPVQYKTDNDVRSDRRKHYRHFKESIENQLEETAFIRCFGGGQSIRAWQRGRLTASFESKESAKARGDSVQTEPAAKRKKSHVSTKVNWDSKKLLEEVESYNDGKMVSWSALAKKYNVTNSYNEPASNGGQIVKEFLIQNGVNVNRFKGHRINDKPIVRRRKRRCAGGEISAPTEVTQSKLRKITREKIESGEYTIGERIVPRKYEKLVLTKDLQIKKVEYVADGRKTTLTDIRRNTLEQHKPYMRQNTQSHYDKMSEQDVEDRLKELWEFDKNKHLNFEERKAKLKDLERTRHFLVWHDNSTVANHGYLACLFTCLYDPAIHLTTAEYKMKTGKDCDIQKMIEQPQIHFIARCGSSDLEQVAYSETRLQCITELKNNITTPEGIQIVDRIRFGNGDNPARAFETGTQKGGHFFCQCGIHSTMTYCLDHALNCPVVTLQNIQDAILQGAVARRKSIQLKPKPLAELSRGELEEELASRGIYDGKNKKELQTLLNEEMRGKQRVPALLYNAPTASMSDLGLEQYEVIPLEPLHDIGHHIENFLKEVPEHLPKPEATFLHDTIELCLGNKDSKRTVDYRGTIVKLAGHAQQLKVLSMKPMMAINTLVEMQRILYKPELERTPAMILRYYNQAWYHSVLLKEIVNMKPKQLTLRKLFGVYFHDLQAHAGLVLRIVSGKSCNAEQQERHFNQIKRITKQTSNYNPGQIIPNIFIRLQAEKEMGLQEDDIERQQNFISTLARCLEPASNTHIPLDVVKKYPREWQAHLEQISDYLLEGEGVWWRIVNQGVVFNDISNFPKGVGPSLHHFRSSSLTSVKLHLKQCWQTCINQKINIPLHVVRVDQEDGRTKKIMTPFLGDLVSDQDAVDETDGKMNGDNCENNNEKYDDTNDDDVDDDEIVVDVTQAPEEIISLDEPGNVQDHKEDVIEDLQQQQLPQHPVKQTTEAAEPSQPQEAIQSKLGKAIEIVIGHSKELQTFDKEHIKLKHFQHLKKSNPSGLQERYRDALARFQVKVLAKKTSVQQELRAWEKAYTLKNNFISPSYEEMKSDPKAGELLKKLKFSKALLKEWKISF